MIDVSWFVAAQYCNWISEQEGIPPEEWCYPKHEAIKAGMKPPQDYLKRRGYRLATGRSGNTPAERGRRTAATMDLL